jgi:hypothetical protein
MACALPHATPQCSGGQCTIASCDTGYGDCNQKAADGCETPTSSDLANCGGCGVVCGSAHASPSCMGGVCTLNCAAGFGNCDGNYANGCEADLTSDPAHCATCNNMCPHFGGTASCVASVCHIACTAPWCKCDMNANTGCMTLCTTTTDCGACGVTCNAAHANNLCANQQCTFQCFVPWADCDGNPANGCEVDTFTDNNNCGTCGTHCTAPKTCQAGNCQ